MTLPIRGPFGCPTERALVAVTLVTLLLSPIMLSWFQLNRSHLLMQIPISETDGAFLVQEIYQRHEPIDVLLLGPCTSWWHIYPPYIKSQMQQNGWNNPNVISLGFNHFGSDLQYLILKDLLQYRPIKNLVLTLPKVEDIQHFPHANAIQWWLYPQDTAGLTGLSLLGHLRLYGLNLFAVAGRSLAITQKISHLSVSRKALGYNETRDTVESVNHLDGNMQPLDNASSLNFRQDEIRVGLRHLAETQEIRYEEARKKLARSTPSLPDEKDWTLFYTQIQALARKKNFQITLVDSPHSADFEVGTHPTAWSVLTDLDPHTNLVQPDFIAWRRSTPPTQWELLMRGPNLTPLGARIFTAAISPALIEVLKK